LHPLFIQSFQRLGVLPREGVGCRPFDVERGGFLISEAAAAVCLELDAPANSFAAIERFAMGADATHLTGTDLRGSTLRHLLKMVMGDRPVDLVHGHGTGTLMNDPVELEALEASLTIRGSGGPVLYSHKGALGHSLGAAGLAAVTLNCLMHRRAIVPPNVQTKHPLTTHIVRLTDQLVRLPIRRSITLAAGFGGPVAVVSLVSE